jgi:hypothetical protein
MKFYYGIIPYIGIGAPYYIGYPPIGNGPGRIGIPGFFF